MARMATCEGGPSWDEMAASYGRQLWLERRALRLLLELLEPRSHERLLDVATGPAPFLAELALRPDRPVEAVGIDSSPAMLERAPELPAGWRLEVADATALPFDDGSFDFVTASYLLHVMDPAERRTAIAEIARVLRPGGRIGTITVAPPRNPVTRALTAPLRAAAERSNGRLRGMRSHDPAPELAAAGLAEANRRTTLAGYPSLVVTGVKRGAR